MTKRSIRAACTTSPEVRTRAELQMAAGIRGYVLYEERLT